MIRILYLCVLLPIIAAAQVTVHINSGNPAYPFPQFQPYTTSSATLKNLGTNNNCGVPHAEMEKTIREAYQIQMNRAVKPGGGVGGIDYIKYRSNPQCSEGDGYGILGPASMADKTTFDGMWLYIHDFTLNKVKRYSDCKDASPGYAYSQLPGWTGAGANSAADGDFDIALALLVAYKQWGEFMGIDDACGNPISYKQAAIDYLTALTDTLTYVASGSGLLSGDIGLDGYIKGGDSWGELTAWAAIKQANLTKPAQDPGPKQQHIDYTAPAYFHQFAEFLASIDSVKYAWNILQFRRATASSDWLMGQLYEASPKNIPFAGWVSLSEANEATFSQFNEGEDFRCAWRTILNYVWNGIVDYSWDPKTHQILPGVTNTYERDFGMRFAKFLWDPRQSPWNNTCVTGANDLYPYWGPSVLWTDWDLDGSGGNFFFLNWIHGVGSPSMVISQDFQLMGESYRQLEIEFDVEEPGDDGYLDATPFYFHGWFRMLGLLMLTGNYPAPSDILPSANAKVYMSIDKSFAFEKDTVTYTIDYRNYGSRDATQTKIVDTLHRDFVFVSASGGGGYDNITHTVTWNLGTLAGFKTATGIPPTTGSVNLKVVIANATEKQYRNHATISCANGSGWTSNEYPNHITAVMERNHLDIARRALILDETVSKTLVKPGETVDFSIDFQNSSDAGWINGGRPGVNFSFSQGSEGTTATMNTMRARIFNDASEAYIDFGNYRISYFLYDEKNTCIAGTGGCTNGWGFNQTITEGIDKKNVKLVHEMIVPGQDAGGKWNQRLIVQFSDPADPARIENLTTTDHHLAEYRGMRQRIHRGGVDPFRLVWYFNSSDWQAVNWGNAWSWDPDTKDTDAGIYYPITNDWSDPDRPDVPVTTWNRKSCEKALKTIDNILVEEWDGYTWRRVAGNGPMPGREANNVVIRDTIPEGFSFVAFTGDNPMGVAPTVSGRVITWAVPRMQIKEGGTITFTAKADGSCPGTADREVVNRAWISADKESPFADSSIITISCDTTVKPPPPDHIDIVLDTLLLDLNRDADFVRIDMDEGTQHAVVYAVIRDRNGKFIRTVNGAVWQSRDNTVVTVSALSATSCQGLIVKAGGGSTIIIVSDPANPELKPDSLAITTLETPPWPAISNAVMGDADGDVVPDLLTFTLNDTFHVNQRLDSVIIEYRGNRFVFPAASVQVQKTLVTVPVPGLTTADPTPTGTVTMVITVDGDEKRVAKTFTDGVGPALVKASLRQDISGANDTLDLAFTEDIAMQTLIGATLQLIRTATGDTVLLTVTSFKGPEFYSETRVTVTTPVTGGRPQEGDKIRLVPEAAGGTVADMKKNLPHLLNRPVVIPERPSQMIAGWYIDDNADGFIDAVVLQFVKPVQASGISVSVMYELQRYEGLSGSALSYETTDQTMVRVTLPADQIVAEGVKTGGAMYSLVTFSDYVGEERTMKISDKAAPVISEAVFKIGVSLSTETAAVDSLIIVFSEESYVADVSPQFLLINQSNLPYSMTLSSPVIIGSKASFAVTAISGDVYPENGDTIYINPQSAVRDSSTWQNNPLNRKVTLKIDRGKVKWNAVVAPNPFNPELNGYNSAEVMVRIVNSLNSSVPVKVSEAHISIYDATGNIVVKPTPFTQGVSGPVFYWNGTNRHGRRVGNGTYIGIVTVEDDGSEGVKRVKIGVMRQMK